MDDFDDPLEANRALDQQILAIPKDKVFTKKAVVAGFLVLAFGIAMGIALQLSIAADTNEAVRHEIPGLKKQIEQRDEQISDLEDINTQAVDWVVALLDILAQHGIEAPQIRIEPKD